MDVPSLMRQALSFNEDRPAVVTEHRTLTFSQMWERGVRLANGLIGLGVRRGDRVAGLEENNLGAADLFLGCAIAGAVRVPLYARNRRLSHGQMIEQTQAKVVVTDHTFVDDLRDLDREIATLEHVVDRGDG
jgi:acyl-CoA synthetase (AMP-forming)/AMP-acid ligase II